MAMEISVSMAIPRATTISAAAAGATSNAFAKHTYLRNAYRGLLTRARQGMVISLPPGSPYGSTRGTGI